ncbi:hypothetical protein HAX54_016053 [Datura stramonium]|uniref:Uncharacterized protein n=1 Tax=Datura stramonium TaxID=4076 RepID=A0ABS8UI91_DATST|nr:hypothetical protein [Datura stramonium]
MTKQDKDKVPLVFNEEHSNTETTLGEGYETLILLEGTLIDKQRTRSPTIWMTKIKELHNVVTMISNNANLSEQVPLDMDEPDNDSLDGTMIRGQTRARQMEFSRTKPMTQRMSRRKIGRIVRWGCRTRLIELF